MLNKKPLVSRSSQWLFGCLHINLQDCAWIDIVLARCTWYYNNMEEKYLKNYIIKPTGKIFNLYTNKEIKPYKMANGYHQVTLYDFNGHHKKFLVHRLVAKAFIKNPNNYETVNHKNFDRSDNRVENLEWLSIGDNLRHARKYGTNIYTKERNAKISKSRKGKPCPEITKIKLSKYWSGGKMAGKNNPMYGKHLTKEQIQKRIHSCYHKNRPVDGCPLCKPITYIS